MRLLFISWDGPQVDYLEGLFLPIFSSLGKYGFHFDVLQFRWGEPSLTQRAQEACEKAGMGYRPVPVIRAMGRAGALLTAMSGGRHVRSAVRQFGSDILMPRCAMPAIAALSAGAKFRPVIFDADGLSADERVDLAGETASGPTYRLLRWAETQAVKRSASVLVRSTAAAKILALRAHVSEARFQVVANGRNEALFHPFDSPARRAAREALGVDPAVPLVLYVGSIGPKYRFDQVAAFAHALARRRPDARLAVLTGSPDLAKEALGPGVPLSPVVLRVAPQDVSKYIAAADLGLAFLEKSFSSCAVSPLKIAEYLLCGVPVFGTTGVGPTGAAVDAGMFLDERAGMDGAVQWLTEEVMPDREHFRSAARAVAVANYGLGFATTDYLKAFQTALARLGKK